MLGRACFHLLVSKKLLVVLSMVDQPRTNFSRFGNHKTGTSTEIDKNRETAIKTDENKKPETSTINWQILT